MPEPRYTSTTVISRDDLGAIVRAVGLDQLMDELIDHLTEAITHFDETRTKVRTRDGFHYYEPEVGLLEWMPVIETGRATTVKMVGYHPTNPDLRDLPTILSTISVYDTDSGHLSGLADGTFLTALRTGAASAIASKVLARPSSRILGIIGTGAQAVTQVHAMMRSFPIEQILIHDASPDHVASFRARIADVVPASVEVKEAPIDLMLQSADIVCTQTSVAIDEGPLFDDVATKPWLHINAVGSDFPGKIEIPREMLRRGLVCSDVLEQAVKEGECQQLAPEEIGPTLAHIVAHPRAYESWQEDLTIFDSTGWALEDQVAMQLLLDHAKRLGLGTEIQLEDIGEDPLDPYRLGHGASGDIQRRRQG